MSRVLAGAKMIEAAYGGFVLLCHHMGKDPRKGLRRHSSLHAAMDAEIEVTRGKHRHALLALVQTQRR